MQIKYVSKVGYRLQVIGKIPIRVLQYVNIIYSSWINQSPKGHNKYETLQ